MAASVSLREYFAAAGSRFTAEDAAIIGPQVEALAEQGDASARSIVDTARSTNSPLHRYYEWDDAVAGDKYRLSQAEDMLRAIKVRVLVDDRPRVMPAYKLAKAEPKPAFRTGHNVLHGESAVAVRKAQEAMDALISWRARYSPYIAVWAEFAKVFQVILNQISESEDSFDVLHLGESTNEAVVSLFRCRVSLLEWQADHADLPSIWSELAEQARFLTQAIEETEARLGPNGPKDAN